MEVILNTIHITLIISSLPNFHRGISRHMLMYNETNIKEAETCGPIILPEIIYAIIPTLKYPFLWWSLALSPLYCKVIYILIGNSRPTKPAALKLTAFAWRRTFANLLYVWSMVIPTWCLFVTIIWCASHFINDYVLLSQHSWKGAIDIMRQ